MTTCWECGAAPENCDCEQFMECECELHGDMADSAACPVHGPNSAMARRIREQEAADEAAWWQGLGSF